MLLAGVLRLPPRERQAAGREPGSLPTRDNEASMRVRRKNGVSGRRATTRHLSLGIAAASAMALVAGQFALTTTPASAATAAPDVLALSTAQAAQLSQNVNQHVIVIMKSQPGQASVGTSAAATRA